ncbi:MAG TPA: hypothetical protein VF165_20390, partial [Nocardioidaceae bacterium]
TGDNNLSKEGVGPMTINDGTSSVQVGGSTGGRLTVVLDRDIEPQEDLAALSDDDARPAAPETFASRPVRRSSRPYAGEFLG